MSELAIRAENLSKRYQIGAAAGAYRYRTFREAVLDAAVAPVRRFRRLKGEATEDETLWALKEVEFEVPPGDVVGIVGRNGAGKSTLLKILSRITEPTEGRVEIHGRVASLLEVGTGFHPELTGRENIYLNGAILGMTRGEMARKFDEIVAFAEVERHIETPVKRYSSGMYLRLAFAVAAHLEPEILVVDEVLAVGDAGFQKKCLGKMENVAREGRTVLFVSHNMTAVRTLCTQAIWLEQGRLSRQGAVDAVVSQYLQTAASPHAQHAWPDLHSAPGNERVRLQSVLLRPSEGDPTEPFTVDTPLSIEVAYWNLQHGARLNLSLLLYNQEGVCVFASTTIDEPVWHGRAFPAGLFRSVCRVPGHLLNSGFYRVRLMVVKDVSLPVYDYDEALAFEVHDIAEGRGDWFGRWPGAIRPRLVWTTELVQSEGQA